MNKTAYFYIITPLNYLYAVEAKHQFTEINKTHLVILTTFQPIIDQLKVILNESEWDTVTYRPKKDWGLSQNTISENIRYALCSRHFVNLHLKANHDRDYVYIGNITNYICRYILSKTPHSRQFVLDDGLATINYIKKLSNPTRKLSTKSIIFNTILPAKKINLKEITFFSVYEKLDFSPFTVIKNELQTLKGLYNTVDWKIENTVLFIGQYLPNANIISKQNYFTAVNKVISAENAMGNKVLYLTHRNDDMDLPDSWNVLKGTVPAELLMLEMKIKPIRIWSFYSTALTCLQRLFETKTTCLYIKPPQNWVMSGQKVLVDNIYSYLASVEPLYGKVIEYDDIDNCTSHNETELSH